MQNRFLMLLTALAFLGVCVSVPAFAGKIKNCDPTNGDVHPSCGGDGGNDHGEPQAQFKVSLTGGGFDFVEMDVTRNNRGNIYNSTEELLLNIDSTAWEVFLTCTVFSGSVPDEPLLVSDNWSIDNSGGNQAGTIGSNILIAFKDAAYEAYSDVDIDLYLRGTLLSLIPDIEDEDPTIYITLDEFSLFGSLKGGHGCKSSGKLTTVATESILRMTRTQ